MTDINKKRKYIPSSFLVIFALMLLFIIASWIGRAIDSSRINGIGFLDIFTAVWHGFTDRAEVILFIFAIGGTLAVMTKIKAIDAGIDALVKKMGDKTLLLIPILMIIFGLGGTTYGMWEETIAFIPILIPVFRKAGYGTFTPIMIILLGAGTGVITSTINPFATGQAVDAANGTEDIIVKTEAWEQFLVKNPNIIQETIDAKAKDEIKTESDAISALIGSDAFANFKKNNTNLATNYVSTGTLQGTRWISFVLFEMLAIGLVIWLATRYKNGIASKFKTDKEIIRSYKKEKIVTGKEKAKGKYFKGKSLNCMLTKSKNAFISFFTRPRIVDGLDEELIEERFKEVESVKFTIKRKISLILFILAFVLMILMYLPWGDFLAKESGSDDLVGTKEYNENMWWFASTSKAGYAKLGGWYFISVSGVFLLVSMIIFAINFQEFRSSKENPEQGMINTYMSGIKDMVTVSILIAVAAGLGRVLDATGYGKLIAEESAKGLSNWLAFGVVIFIVSIILSLLVPSTSGFANAFIPIFAAIAVKAFPNEEKTAIGIVILGFIFANGLANFVTPTSATLMGYTQYAGIPYNVWIRETWKFTFALFLLSLLLILVFSAAADSGSSLF